MTPTSATPTSAIRTSAGILSISLADSERALDKAINGLRNEDPGRSAAVAIVGWQRAVIWTVLVLTVGFGIWRPMQTAVALIGFCTLGYVLTMIDRVQVFRQGLAYRAIVITDDEARAIPDDELPRYTILVPAYNEPEVVGDLLAAMAQLEYPADKMQVLLLLEADDEVTITAAEDYQDSESVTIVLVPPADPAPSRRPATTVCSSPPGTSSPSTTPRTCPSRCNCVEPSPRSPSCRPRSPASSPSSRITMPTRTC